MAEVLHYTLGELSDRNAQLWPEGEAFVDLSTSERLTWQDFSVRTDQLARGFMALGLKPGQHLALWGGSSITWVVAQYAAAKTGLIVVSADPEYEPDQISYLLEQSDAEILFIIGGYKDRHYGAIAAELCTGFPRGEALRVRGASLPCATPHHSHSGPSQAGLHDPGKSF